MLLTEQSNPDTREIDQESTLGILKLINQEDVRVAVAVEQQLESIARVIDAVVLRLEGDGRLFYVGTGTSGRLVLPPSEPIPVWYRPSWPEAPGLLSGRLKGRKTTSRAVRGILSGPV
jgi:N-acetylmuramic acid 6-phosphate etherase